MSESEAQEGSTGDVSGQDDEGLQDFLRSEQFRYVIVALIALFFGFAGAAESQQPASSFIFSALFFGGIAWLLLTEAGRDVLNSITSMANQQQQQQAGTGGGENGGKRICSNCGWRNPVSNNYCHDCGEPLGASDG